MHVYRTHNCGQLTIKNVGETVRLAGWIHRKRDHGNLLFIDLRDHFGITQCVSSEEKILEALSSITVESVIIVTGKVVARNNDTINRSLNTGEIEIDIQATELESIAEPLPIQVNSDLEFPEDTRLRYRFLDLRREKIHNNIVLRSKVISYIRQQMEAQGFLEFQTPILTASSPEGARDYLVPSRIHPGKFYALPQAPQQFKQLLMMAGFDRYFQIAPCFRDEDGRSDRSPGEFYQLDIEMSFVTQEDVFATIEPVIHSIFKQFSTKEVTSYPFPRIPYRESMLKYGNDKPDLRNPLIISDVTDIFKDAEFAIFRNNIQKGFVVRAIPAPSTANLPRSFFDGMNAFAQELGASGLGYIIFNDNNTAKGPIAKFLSTEKLDKLKEISGCKAGDTLFFSCDTELNAAKLAGKVRTKLAQELSLIEENSFRFCWVTDFPYFEWNEEKNMIDFSHNPFSMPQGGLEALEQAKTKEQLLELLAYQYDIVCNGVELSSGAIRNHKPELMYKAFSVVGYDQEEVDARFGGLIKAFKYGAPPHGGLAPGVDRIVMLLADEPNIREVICFPMNQQAQDLLMNAPNTVSDSQLRELHLELSQKAKKIVKKEEN